MTKDRAAVKRACAQTLMFDGPVDPAASLATLAAYAPAEEADFYGTGPQVQRLEARTAELLGKPAALYMPSGKTAQLAALKVWAERARSPRIALHPRSHIAEAEADSFTALWGLSPHMLCGPNRLPRLADLDGLAGPVGAVTLELPLRPLGCRLPDWDDLVAFSQAVRARGIALHLDGARIWESQPYYGRSLAEIAGLFDSIYVSYYKGLGGLSGAALAGPSDMIEEAKAWQVRAGSRLIHSFPYVLSALRGLDERLPRMAEYHAHAKALAARLKVLPGVLVTPDPPQANAFLIMLPGRSEMVPAIQLEVAEATGLWLFDWLVDCPFDGHVMFEVTVRAAAAAVPVETVFAAVSELARRLGD